MKKMNKGKSLLLFLSIAATLWADKKDAPFRPEAAEAYATKQTIQELTIAVQPFDDPEEAKSAFGKLNPYNTSPTGVGGEKNDGKAPSGLKHAGNVRGPARESRFNASDVL
jgi:hypothetical protein